MAGVVIHIIVMSIFFKNLKISYLNILKKHLITVNYSKNLNLKNKILNSILLKKK
jgi:hypothetical protein